MSSRADRARQFMPFAALKGYEELVHDKEKIVSDRRELSEYRQEKISERLLRITKGTMIRIVYYHNDGYIKTEGMVSSIDITMQYLTLVKTKIDFFDIYDIAIESDDTQDGDLF